ncbi:uncharacterized protein LOC132475485 isoform X1 [Gadus macrocephalus]|uniref:uncharacterized protein LOC132475485 isoform X1 n=1 Tax=Gadus macrocephalus TaxID=80720 RepID=UPI0028CB8609|nr:uncharacterized protein LOC132475485 isoform X1 [Gadus macrocephalus]
MERIRLVWAWRVVCVSADSALYSAPQTAPGEHLPMAPVPCLITATLLLSVWLCGANSPTCPKRIDVKVGDKVEIPSCSTAGITESYWKYEGEKIVQDLQVKPSRFKERIVTNNTTYNLILSGVTQQDSGTFGFFSSKDHDQIQTVFFNLTVYEAITHIDARVINSTWDPDASKCEIWLKCTALHSESGNSVNYTWTIGNETHTGATFRYFTTEGEDTGKCTTSNPVSEKSASIQVECRNSTQAGAVGHTDQSTPIPKIWIYISTGLGVLVLVLVLVFVCGFRRRNAAPEVMDTVYDSIENVEWKATTSKDEPSLGPLYELIQNVEATAPQQESTGNTIYYTVQQSRLMDPPS